MASNRTRVTIVVDRPELREAVGAKLCEHDFDCTSEFESIVQLASHDPLPDTDALVLRVGTSRREIMDAFKSVRSLLPDTPIVGLWPDDLRREDRRVLMTGIDGLLEENQIEDALISTVRAVRSGLICLPRRTPGGTQADTLSSREKQVLGMLIMGFTNAEIGQRLYVAESTVKSHLSSAYTKLGVRSRKDAAALILDPNEGLGTGVLAISGAAG